MNDENRIKKNLNNNQNNWWLRSAYSDYSDFVACVCYDGDEDISNYYDENGVVPAFII